MTRKLSVFWLLLPFLSSCASLREEPLRLEALRKNLGGREETVYLRVEASRLAAAGVSEAEAVGVAREFFVAFEAFLADVLLGRPASETKADPPWLARVFPDGLLLEIDILEKDGPRRTERLKIPIQTAHIQGRGAEEHGKRR